MFFWQAGYCGRTGAHAEVAVEPRAVTVRYRYRDRGEAARDGSFRGRFYECTEAAVRRSLRQAHRFAESVEIVEVRWHGPREAAPTASVPGI